LDDLSVFSSVNFDWVMRLDHVWQDVLYDVPELNGRLRNQVLERCRLISRQDHSASPLGWVVVGPAGAGKTHFLAELRREAAAGRTTFILADLTDVKDFWETLLLGCLNSLREPENRPQYILVLEGLFEHLGLDRDKAVRNVKVLARMPPRLLVKNTLRILKILARRYKALTIEHQDVIRALILWNSDDLTLGNLGYNWLLGLGLTQAEAQTLGLKKTRQTPLSIVKGLSWLFSLRGPTLLAFDQLDAIVAEHHLAAGPAGPGRPPDAREASLAIIEGLGRGLSALADHTRRTLSLVVCLESTWEILRQTVLQSSTDRFEPVRKLSPAGQAETARQLVERRLALAYRAAGFTPPYLSWPFKPQAFEELVGFLPREILKRCEVHRRNCLAQGQVDEAASFSELAPSAPTPSLQPVFKEMDFFFQALRGKADLARLLDEENEDRLGELLQCACRCLVKESRLPDDLDVVLETKFGGGQTYAPLHARLALVYVKAGAEETHICFRAVQKLNPNAYLARLKAALTASGLDRNLAFRRLFIIRRHPIPEGPKTQEVTAAFLRAGGKFADLSDDELRTLDALRELEAKAHPHFAEWLQDRRPVSRIGLMRQAAPELVEEVSAQLKDKPSKDFSISGRLKGERSQPGWRPPEFLSLKVPLGRVLEGDLSGRTLSLSAAALARHVVVMAGSGAGKTVLIRRLVEEAALLGLPSIVIDSANDLARLGDPWPEPPEHWAAGDEDKAAAYFSRTETVVWTPGQASGRPLNLNPMPDFLAVAGDQDALEETVQLALAGFEEMAVTGRSGKTKKLKGVLAAALRYFAERGGGGLTDFIDLLSQLPIEAGAKIKAAPKLAQEMADLLRARLQTDPLLSQTGPKLDPAKLFGFSRSNRRTRISVLNLIGLPHLEMRRQFLARLAMELFTWVQAHPPAAGRGLTGLLVVDEARDFLPAVRTTACKEGLLRLAAQGRKYGLGLILATQNPKDIDYNALGQFSSWFFGLANAPQSIKQIRKMLEERGGAGQGLATLTPGQFFVVSAGQISPPVKIAAPMCLSYHPNQTLTEAEVLEKAGRAGP